MRLFIKDFFSKCDQICRKLRIWSHLLKKSLIENFIFCVVTFLQNDVVDANVMGVIKNVTNTLFQIAEYLYYKLKYFIMPLIVIKIAPLTVLFCNCPLADW